MGSGGDFETVTILLRFKVSGYILAEIAFVGMMGVFAESRNRSRRLHPDS